MDILYLQELPTRNPSERHVYYSQPPVLHITVVYIHSTVFGPTIIMKSKRIRWGRSAYKVSVGKPEETTTTTKGRG
jgi:hypothetical protein